MHYPDRQQSARKLRAARRDTLLLRSHAIPFAWHAMLSATLSCVANN